MSVIASIIEIVLVILFIINFFKKRKEDIYYKVYEMFFIVVLLVFNILIFTTINMYLLHPFISTGLINGMLIVVDIILLLQIYVVVFNGVYFSEKLENNDIPILKRKFFDMKKLNFNIKYAIPVIAFGVIALIYTIVLFKIFKPNPSIFIEDMMDVGISLEDIDYKPNFLILLIALKASIVEEIIYRFAYQNFFAYKFKLAGKKYIIAILISTILWTIAHTSSLDLVWVKYAQVFPMGIALGYIYKKWGLEVSILSHGLFNVLMVLFGMYFII